MERVNSDECASRTVPLYNQVKFMTVPWRSLAVVTPLNVFACLCHETIPIPIIRMFNHTVASLATINRLTSGRRWTAVFSTLETQATKQTRWNLPATGTQRYS